MTGHRNTYALGGRRLKWSVYVGGLLAHTVLIWGMGWLERWENAHVLDFGGDD